MSYGTFNATPVTGADATRIVPAHARLPLLLPALLLRRRGA